MNFSNVKLVVTDLDGTLLNPQGEVSSRFLALFEVLRRHNIHIVAASGRQYQSIFNVLHPIGHRISIIAENGALTKYEGEKRVLLPLSYESVTAAIGMLRRVEGAHVVLSGERSAYVESLDPNLISALNASGTEYVVVEDLTRVTHDVFLKVTGYHPKSSEYHILPHVGSLKKDVRAVVSDVNYLDISHVDANKGYPLMFLQKALGITREETMAFGNYNNDLQMLSLAHFSFAVANAHPEVKSSARFETKSNSEAGVEIVLERLVRCHC